MDPGHRENRSAKSGPRNRRRNSGRPLQQLCPPSLRMFLFVLSAGATVIPPLMPHQRSCYAPSKLRDTRTAPVPQTPPANRARPPAATTPDQKRPTAHHPCSPPEAPMPAALSCKRAQPSSRLHTAKEAANDEKIKIFGGSRLCRVHTYWLDSFYGLQPDELAKQV